MTLYNFLNAFNGLHRVRVRSKLNTETDSGITIVLCDNVICLLSRFNSRNIFHANERTFAVRFDYNVAKLLDGRKSSLNFARELFFLTLSDRHRSDCTGGGLQILFAECVGNVGNSQIEFCEFIGVQPNSHGIIRAENLNVADAADTFNFVHQINIRVIFHESAVVSSFGRIKRNEQSHFVGRFFCRHALSLNVRRQTCICNRDVILNFNRVHIAVRTDFKNDAQTVASGVVGV